MKLSEVFDTETLNSEEKIAKIASVVEDAKAAYGNQDVDINEPEVTTANGLAAISMLSADSKVELARIEVERIKMNAYEDSQTPGVVMNKRIQEYLAISPVLSNITASIDNDYI